MSTAVTICTIGSAWLTYDPLPRRVVIVDMAADDSTATVRDEDSGETFEAPKANVLRWSRRRRTHAA